MNKILESYKKPFIYLFIYLFILDAQVIYGSLGLSARLWVIVSLHYLSLSLEFRLIKLVIGHVLKEGSHVRV